MEYHRNHGEVMVSKSVIEPKLPSTLFLRITENYVKLNLKDSRQVSKTLKLFQQVV
jgi:hypothetical protein